MSTNTITQTKEGKFKLVLSRGQYSEMQAFIRELVEITSYVVRQSKITSPYRTRMQLYSVIISELFLRKAKDFYIIAEENHITLRPSEALCILELVSCFGDRLTHFQTLLGWIIPEIQQKTA